MNFKEKVLTIKSVIKHYALDPYKNFAFGRYAEKYMTNGMRAVRFFKFVIMDAAAWFHLT